MRIVQFLFTSAAFILIMSSCNNVDFKKTKGGMPYKIFPGKGDKKAVNGGYLKVAMITKINDSVLGNTYGKMPQYLPVSNETQPYDPSEIIPQLKQGDSVYIVQMIDTFMKRNPASVPPNFKKGDKIITTIKVLDVFKTPEETERDFEKEQITASSGQMKIDDKIIIDYLAKNNIKAQKTGRGTYVEIITPGTGAQVAEGKQVSVKYRGATFAGKVFDTNMDNSFNHTEPMVFVVGAQPMIKGFDEGIKQLREGSKAKFYIPSSLAYGTNSPSPDVPANTNMVFEIEVLKVGPPTPPSNMPAPATTDSTHR